MGPSAQEYTGDIKANQITTLGTLRVQLVLEGVRVPMISCKLELRHLTIDVANERWSANTGCMMVRHLKPRMDDWRTMSLLLMTKGTYHFWHLLSLDSVLYVGKHIVWEKEATITAAAAIWH